MTTETIRRVFEYDHDKQKWCCHVGGPGDAVIETDTLQLMEDFLDDLDMRIAAAETDQRRINLTLRRQGHAGNHTERRGVCCCSHKQRGHASGPAKSS